MLARSRVVRLLDDAISFETPVLVPGFSSKAVGPLQVQKPGKSSKREETVASLVHSETLTPRIDEALLVSAYDINHGHLASAGSFKRGFARSTYAKPRLLIIDSGWYEKSVGPSSGPFYHEVGAADPWEEEDFIATIDGLDGDIQAIVVSWDDDPALLGSTRKGKTYRAQIERAQQFFASRPHVGSTLLLKPPGRAAFHFEPLRNLTHSEAGDLRFFSAVGVTEKQLGDSISQRLEALATLRRKLDEAAAPDPPPPIHVFGGLDPLHTPLYFAAGAEIFDGLGWLRYAYRDGFAYHREAAPLFDALVTKRWSQSETTTQLDNLDEITKLTDEMKMFVESDGDWTKFRAHLTLKRAFEACRVPNSGVGQRRRSSV
jgi:hypothetical protein